MRPGLAVRAVRQNNLTSHDRRKYAEKPKLRGQQIEKTQDASEKHTYQPGRVVAVQRVLPILWDSQTSNDSLDVWVALVGGSSVMGCDYSGVEFAVCLPCRSRASVTVPVSAHICEDHLQPRFNWLPQAPTPCAHWQHWQHHCVTPGNVDEEILGVITRERTGNTATWSHACANSAM